MKSVLVPARPRESLEGALAAAVTVARRFGSHIEVLFVVPGPQVIVGDAMALAPIYDTTMRDQWLAEARKAEDHVKSFMRRHKIAVGDAPATGKGPSAGWREVEGREAATVGEYGRLFDLIIIGQQGDDERGEVTATVEAALFESGRPVLLAPSEPVKALGRTIVIAWNGSTETARTIGLGMPFIEAAEKVVVLTVEGGTVPGPSGDEVAAHLARHGIDVSAVTKPAGGRSAGESILEEAGSLGADLLFKGAYTHSRLRQMVFGGATRHILEAAGLPVLMAH